tara:strand:+ start:108 stop:1178 length:1071 start_codon:yes stop_codon:yes gene_type:complete
MNEIFKIDDFNVSPNIPKSTGMRVIGIYPDFDYKNQLDNAYGKNIAKLEGTDEKIRDIICEAIKSKQWKPEHYPKPATMEKTDVDGIFNQLTGFTSRSGHLKASNEGCSDGDTMFIYLVEFFDAPDDDGVMQPAEYWRRAWRTKENVKEDFDYIKSDYNNENTLNAAADLLPKSNYVPDDDGVYMRSNIVAVLKSIGIKNPSDTWINNVRAKINPNVGVMTNAEDFDTTDNVKLKDSIITTANTFGGIKDPKMDSQTIDDIEEQIFDNADKIKDKLESDKPFNITIVGKTKNAMIDKAEKIRGAKKDTLICIFEKRVQNYRVIIDLIDNHGFSAERAIKTLWRGQMPNEEEGELYD